MAAPERLRRGALRRRSSTAPPRSGSSAAGRTSTRGSGGTPSGATEHLANRQGFYIADVLAPALPPSARVVMAYDFSADPERLELLRARIPGLEGIREGVGLDELLIRLLAPR